MDFLIVKIFSINEDTFYWWDGDDTTDDKTEAKVYNSTQEILRDEKLSDWYELNPDHHFPEIENVMMHEVSAPLRKPLETETRYIVTAYDWYLDKGFFMSTPGGDEKIRFIEMDGPFINCDLYKKIHSFDNFTAAVHHMNQTCAKLNSTVYTLEIRSVNVDTTWI